MIFFQYMKKNVKGDVDEQASRPFKFKGESLTLDFLEKNPESIEILQYDEHPYEVSVVNII